MSMTRKKPSHRLLAGSSVGRLNIRRDPATGKLVMDDIVAPNGNLVVKGGPITGGKAHRVLIPRGRTKMPRKQLDEFVGLMMLKLPA